MARVHVLGGSGSGTTTLARAVAVELGAVHFDTDDFYWLPTDPPFRDRRAEGARRELLREALEAPRWTLSGSLCGWGDCFVSRFELVVHLDVPGEVRLGRLRAREQRRYGREAIAPGGALHAAHVAFLAWAASYDDAEFAGRSRAVHLRWMDGLPCRVLRLDGEMPTAALVERVVAGLGCVG
jgi:adenylate kinase family enzyme